ncbi:SDR family oxidoreductase [Thermosynechococcaceae cyanobacterium BACA0444]|uniref:SDR family oxidoreductase n=1 Tax=Pseudocalidococcus azoricus BACA0444 TaxID=2918990 RepID=A0AAE4JWD7_9CYAN|nr:SDR family oxidoreductase [Pseudocalidococcus azoricus]MDS3860038.1 SDR family oxidoreductase [Pseudocalidococcus azoricus BACA0444]
MFLVTGASGQLGRRVVQRLCAQNIPVRAFVRLSSDYDQLRQWGADLYIGDVQNQRDLVKAAQGVRYIIACHGSKISSGQHLAVDYRSSIELIEIAKAIGLEHFTYISALAVTTDRQDSPLLKAKWEVENHLQASGLNYTILRPATLMSSLIPLAVRFQQTGVYLLLGNPEHRIGLVSTDDLAKIALAAPQTPAAYKQTFTVASSQVLYRQDVPQIFGRFFNKQPITINVPQGAVDGAWTMLGLFNAEIKNELGTLRTLLGHECYGQPQEIERMEQTFGLGSENLETFLSRHFNQIEAYD